MHILIEGILMVAAFLAGVYFAPEIRSDVVKLDTFVKQQYEKDMAALKASAKKGIDKL